MKQDPVNFKAIPVPTENQKIFPETTHVHVI